MISKHAFNEWLSNPITIQVFEVLSKYRQYYETLLLEGVPVDGNTSVHGIYEAIGRINAYDDLLKIHYGNIEEEEELESDQ